MEFKPAKVEHSKKAEQCWRCNGTGHITESRFYGAGFSDETQLCSVCCGTGKAIIKTRR